MVSRLQMAVSRLARHMEGKVLLVWGHEVTPASTVSSHLHFAEVFKHGS